MKYCDHHETLRHRTVPYSDIILPQIRDKKSEVVISASAETRRYHQIYKNTSWPPHYTFAVEHHKHWRPEQFEIELFFKDDLSSDHKFDGSATMRVR